MEERESDIWVLCEELMVEILTRVGPVKCTVRCKLVCKFWCSLIVYNNTDSHWLRRWHQINPNFEPAVVALFTTYQSKCNESKEYSPRTAIDCNCNDNIKLDFLPSPVCVLDFHKDLLMCCPDRSDHSCYYICNPLTRQWTALPPPPPAGLRHRQATKDEEIRFNKESKVVSSGRLTVVRIIPFQLMGPDLERRVRMWVLGRDGEWKEVEEHGMFRVLEGKRSCKKMVSYKGRLVWLSRDRYNYMKELSLLNCDLDSNDCVHLPLTPGFPALLPEITRSKITIGVCQGRLRLALVAHRLTKLTKLTVWELDDQRQDWDMVREMDPKEVGESSRDWVRLRSIYECMPWFNIKVRGMALHPEDGDILYMVVTMTGNRGINREWSSHLFMWNLDENTLELIRTFPTVAVLLKIFPLVQPSWPTPVPKVISDLIIT